MTSEAPPAVRPGYCSDHPNQRLVRHRTFGIAWYASEDPETVCPMGHDEDERDRCRWCGGRLVEPGIPTWQTSQRRAYCTPNHRLRAHRESKR